MSDLDPRDLLPDGTTADPGEDGEMDPSITGECLRALELSANMRSEDLDAGSLAWLREHLDACADCREAAAAYERQHEAFAQLPALAAPADLRARTFAALDREMAETASPAAASAPAAPAHPTPIHSHRPPAHAPAPRAAARAGGRGFNRAAYGALAAAAVVVALVGGTLVNGIPTAAPASTSPSSLLAQATPIAVEAAPVAWVTEQSNGQFAISSAIVDQVCPSGAESSCSSLDAKAHTVATLPVKPASVVVAPDSSVAVVGDQGTSSSGGALWVVDLAAKTSPTTPSIAPSATAAVTSIPTASVQPSASAATTPASSATAGATSSAAASQAPSTQPSAGSSAGASNTPASASPSAGATARPTASPLPSVEGARAIIADVVIVDDASGWSRNGTWFAFSARPADGSQGPDVYVWRSGWSAARAITTDHASIFASWAGNLVVASSVVGAGATAEASPSPSASAESSPVATASNNGQGGGSGSKEKTSPSGKGGTSNGNVGSGGSSSPTVGTDGSVERTAISFTIDPTSGTVHNLPSGTWRPIVDASGDRVVYWTGSVHFDAATGRWSDGTGRIVVTTWSALATGDGPGTDEMRSLPTDLNVSLADGRTWEVRWDPDGGHFGLWVADLGGDGTTGRLSLVGISGAAGEPTPVEALVRGESALCSFVLLSDRIIWVEPKGQGQGKGASIHILAWRGRDAGQVRTDPVADSSAVLLAR